MRVRIPGKPVRAVERMNGLKYMAFQTPTGDPKVPIRQLKKAL